MTEGFVQLVGVTSSACMIQLEGPIINTDKTKHNSTAQNYNTIDDWQKWEVKWNIKLATQSEISLFDSAEINRVLPLERLILAGGYYCPTKDQEHPWNMIQICSSCCYVKLKFH